MRHYPKRCAGPIREGSTRCLNHRPQQLKSPVLADHGPSKLLRRTNGGACARLGQMSSRIPSRFDASLLSRQTQSHSAAGPQAAVTFRAGRIARNGQASVQAPVLHQHLAGLGTWRIVLKIGI
jgi:hypothetical protein